MQLGYTRWYNILNASYFIRQLHGFLLHSHDGVWNFDIDRLHDRLDVEWTFEPLNQQQHGIYKETDGLFVCFSLV